MAVPCYLHPGEQAPVLVPPLFQVVAEQGQASPYRPTLRTAPNSSDGRVPSELMKIW